MAESPPARPRVSVMVPCYNAAAELRIALTSLLCQTFEDWECVVVDDGSEDCPERVVEDLGDSRIRLVAFERNRGRGVARQRALDESRGELLAFLDADDWWYPDKLQRQVQHLDREPDVVLVSTGVAVTRGPDRLTGVRGRGDERSRRKGPFRGVGPAPVVFPPTVMRMEAARAAGFDAGLRRAQDLDFLLQVLQGRRWGVLDYVGYAYDEDKSFTPANIYEGLFHTRRVFRKFRPRFPLQSRLQVGKIWLKRGVYAVAAATGLLDRLIARRSRAPTAEERDAFERAWSTVRSRLGERSERPESPR